MPTGGEITSIVEGMMEVTMGFQAALGVPDEIRSEESGRPRTRESPQCRRHIVSTLPVLPTRTPSTMALDNQTEARCKNLRLPTTGRSVAENFASWDIAPGSVVSVQLASCYSGSENTPD